MLSCCCAKTPEPEAKSAARARSPANAALPPPDPARPAQIVQNIFLSEKCCWLRGQVLTYYDQNGTKPPARLHRKRSLWPRPQASQGRAAIPSPPRPRPESPSRAAPSRGRKAMGIALSSKRPARRPPRGESSRPRSRRRPPPKRPSRRRLRRLSDRPPSGGRLNGERQPKFGPPPFPPRP